MTCGAATTGHLLTGAASPAKSACCAGVPINRAFGDADSIPSPSSPWSGLSSSWRARSTSSPSSASLCAEPTCTTIRRRPPTDSAICTAVAPEAVRTRRIHATHTPQGTN